MAFADVSLRRSLPFLLLEVLNKISKTFLDSQTK
jgi:hypothetical protein